MKQAEYSTRPPHHSGVSHVDLSRQRIRIPGRQPDTRGLSMKAETEVFLSKYRDALRKGVFGSDLQEQYGGYVAERQGHMLRAGIRFDQLTAPDPGRRLIMPEEDPILAQVNQGTELEGKSYAEVLTEYYEQLRQSIDIISQRMKLEGSAYMMDGVSCYRDEAVGDWELMCRKFAEAGQVSWEQLAVRSEVYQQVLTEIEREKAVPEKSDVDRAEIIRKLEGVVVRLARGKGSEELPREIHVSTARTLRHLEMNLGQKGLEVLGRSGRRPLDALPGGPANHYEFLLALQNRAIEVYREIVATHRDLIGGALARPSLEIRQKNLRVGA